MTSVEKLDTVLSILVNHGGNDDRKEHSIDHFNLFVTYIDGQVNISAKELTEICLYLIDEKSIYSEDVDNIPTYFSTFKGRHIHENGGYDQKIKEQQLDKERVKRIEKGQKRHSYYMIALTLILTLTAVKDVLDVIRNYYNYLFPFTLKFIAPLFLVGTPCSLIVLTVVLLYMRISKKP